MIIHKGYIVEATERELWEYYLKHEFDDVMPFDTYLELMRNHGVHIIEDEAEAIAATVAKLKEEVKDARNHKRNA